MENPGAIDMVLGNNQSNPEKPTTYCVESLNKKLREHAANMSAKNTFKRGDIVRLNALGIAAADPQATLRAGQEAMVMSWGKTVTTQTNCENADVELNLFNIYGNFVRIFGDSRMLELVKTNQNQNSNGENE